MAIVQLDLLHPDTNAAFKTYSLLSRTTEGSAMFTDVTAGSPTEPMKKSTIILQFSPMSAKRSTDKYGIRVNIPRIVTSGTSTIVESIGRFTSSGGFVFPASWNLTERENLVHIVSALLKDAQLHDHLVNRKAI